jgi:S1-C subfamily serine protease
VGVDGKPVHTSTDLSELIAGHKPGDVVSLEVLRDNDTHQVQVTLGARPADVNP